MKQLLATLLLLTLCLTACGEDTVSCPAAGDDPADGTSEISVSACLSEAPESRWSVNDDITIFLEQGVYPPGTDSFTVTFENTGEQTMLYGESYMFQHNDGSGWKDLETIENYGFNSIGYQLTPGAKQTLDVGTWLLAEPLTEGRYRIVGCTLRVADDEEQLGYGGDYTEYAPYELEFDITEGASAPVDTAVHDTAFHLEIGQLSPGDTNLPFTIVNASGADAEILLIPTLEKMTGDDQWEVVPFLPQVGFCGTPDPLPVGRKDWSEDLDYLWGELADGDYRLSFTVTDHEGSEYLASGQFTFDDGLCSLPLAE